jgi:hypothetical protein
MKQSPRLFMLWFSIQMLDSRPSGGMLSKSANMPSATVGVYTERRIRGQILVMILDLYQSQLSDKPITFLFTQLNAVNLSQRIDALVF